MTKHVRALLGEVEKLSPLERIELVDKILESLDKPDPEIEAAWADEAEKRLAEMDSGRVQAIPAAEVHARVVKRLKG